MVLRLEAVTEKGREGERGIIRKRERERGEGKEKRREEKGEKKLRPEGIRV